MNEFALINLLKKKIPHNLQGAIGIGDDAGVFTVPLGESLAFTSDIMVEGVDFFFDHKKKNRKKLGVLSPEKTGAKALAINFSDLAAMGAYPRAFIVSLGVPKDLSADWLKRFYQGMMVLARQFNTACVGGDVSRSKEFFVTIALVGSSKPKQLVQRKGARPGDWIGVTGALGGSLLRRHAIFQPRIAAGQFLAKNFKPTSMIDISDGLIQDLEHILRMSGVGAALELTEIPISGDAVKLAKGDGMKAFERACTDGEDFELLWTMRPSQKFRFEKAWRKQFSKIPLSWIGRIEKGTKIRWTLQGRAMKSPKFKRGGFQHF